MAKRSLLVWLARALAAYSLLVYAVGLLVIALPTALERGLGAGVPDGLRRAVVAVTLAVMVATYLAERRFAFDGGREPEARSERAPGAEAGDRAHDAPGASGARSENGAPSHSLSARVSLSAAALGVAVGVYVAFALERPVVGVLFVAGAYLFVRMAYRREGRRRGE